jgi:hypothetical protein
LAVTAEGSAMDCRREGRRRGGRGKRGKGREGSRKGKKEEEGRWEAGVENYHR